MKYKDLFTGSLLLFNGIFKETYPYEYTKIFGDTNADTFALLKHGNKTVLEAFTVDNAKDFASAVISMCVDRYVKMMEVLNTQYNFMTVVRNGSVTEKTVELKEENTDGKTTSDKAFNDDGFVDDSKETTNKDRTRTETEKISVQNTGFDGNVTEAMLKEYRARMIKVRESIVDDLVSYITISIYN